MTQCPRAGLCRALQAPRVARGTSAPSACCVPMAQQKQHAAAASLAQVAAKDAERIAAADRRTDRVGTASVANGRPDRVADRIANGRSDRVADRIANARGGGQGGRPRRGGTAMAARESCLNIGSVVRRLADGFQAPATDGGLAPLEFSVVGPRGATTCRRELPLSRYHWAR